MAALSLSGVFKAGHHAVIYLKRHPYLAYHAASVVVGKPPKVAAHYVTLKCGDKSAQTRDCLLVLGKHLRQR